MSQFKYMLRIARNSLYLAISFAVLMALSAVNFPVSAQSTQQSGVTVSPLVFELNSDPGSTVVNQVKIFNPTDFPIEIQMKMEDFSPVGEEGNVVLSEPGDNATFSIASWTAFSPSSFRLEPRQQQIVNFTVTAPPNAEPGGHYGSIVAFIAAAGSNGSGSSIATKTGSLVLMRISGSVKENLIIKSFETKPNTGYGPIDFVTRFENTGNVHVRPAGFINVVDMFGREVAQIEIPKNNVIPQAVRLNEAQWGETNLFGRYTATLVATYGANQKQTLTETIVFTVIPWREVLLIGGIILIVLFLLFVARKRLSRAMKVLLQGDKR